jgi:TPR repeat protein
MIGSKINQMAVWVLLAALLAACGTVPPADQGAIDYEQGRYDQAAAEWGSLANDGNYIAQHNMGGLSRHGLGSTSENLEEAAGWFYASAIQGYVPAMVSLAEVQTELGFDDSAEAWLLFAARWGNVEAIEHLKQKGVTVPEADLYGKQMDEQTLDRLNGTGTFGRPMIGRTQPLGITDN